MRVSLETEHNKEKIAYEVGCSVSDLPSLVQVSW